jgi:cobaltochelatase CobS
MTALLPDDLPARPDLRLDAGTLFGLPGERTVWGFSRRTAWVPAVDPAYRFDPATTLAILAGFQQNRRVIIQGLHGTGKSTHIEQVAARLNWPCVRVNLDSHISRIDLIGKDAIILREGRQVTEYREGILPWAFQRPVALVFDEYDAGRPDVMFVIQRVLEADSRLTVLDQNRVIDAHPGFRLFATANTIGLGDPSGLYHGTQPINQAQMDRWHIVTRLDYLAHEVEVAIVAARVPAFDDAEGHALLGRMVRLAELTRQGFRAGDVSTLMSPRTVISWAENARIFGSVAFAFLVTFLNRCDETERPVFAEYYQRALVEELPDDTAAALACAVMAATAAEP